MREMTFKVRFLTEQISAAYIRTEASAERALKKLLKAEGTLGLDTETQGKWGKKSDEALSPISGQVRLLQLYDKDTAYIFDFRDVNPLLFKNLLATKKFVAHNALFDLAMLKGSGLSVPHIGCTFIASKLITHERYPNDSAVAANLRNIVQLLYSEDVLKVHQTSNWAADSLTFEQISYAALDAICTLKVSDKLGPVIVRKKLEKVYNLYKKAQHPLAEMELNGIGFDVKAHQVLMEASREKLLAARSKVLSLTGLSTISPHTISDWLKGNLPSEALSIWPKTSTGKLSTASQTFEEFSYLEIVTPILAFNTESKLLSSFGHSLLAHVNPATTRIHAKYNIAGARTGRLSCSKPNIQQMPREALFRNLFVAPPGRVIISADFSQIEVRIAAEISGDEKMKNIYRRGLDMYKETASRILRKPVNSITKFERQCAKAVVLGSQFGLGAKKFSQYARINYGISDITEEKALEFITAYREAYPDFRSWQLKQTKECEKSLKATTVLGKSRALDKDNYYGQALNQPVQGSAAEVFLSALVRFHKNKEQSSLLIACVHDEILVEAKEEDATAVKHLLETSMVEGFKAIFPTGVDNNLVEAKIGKTWGDCK